MRIRIETEYRPIEFGNLTTHGPSKLDSIAVSLFVNNETAMLSSPNFHTVAYQLTVPKVLPMPSDPAAWDDIHAKCGQLVSCFSIMRCYRSHVSH